MLGLGPKTTIKKFIKLNAGLYAFGCLWIFCVYPAVIRPYLYPELYKQRREIMEKGLHKPHPPGGLREWSNPFEERKKEQPIILQQKLDKQSSSQ